nr:unnamed protein product [Callosobruchus chinensis]
MSSCNSTSLESCDCKPSGNVLILNDCDKCCGTGIKKDFCRKNQTCIYRKSGSSKGVEKCPCSGAKAELAHRPISKREKCLKCCKETKFTFNRFISMCQMDPDCIINMYKTRNTNGRLLPEIQNENMPGNLMVDKNMEACDSDEEKSNPRSILVAKAPIVLTKYNPQQTRLSAWSNRGPSIIWTSQTPSAKRKSISFAQPIDSPKISQRSSGMESQFLVLNQVIAQQNKDTKKNSIESMQSALGKVRCSILLNILPWRWKCFKRKKKIGKSKSHSITESVVSDSATKYRGNASVSDNL